MATAPSPMQYEVSLQVRERHREVWSSSVSPRMVRSDGDHNLSYDSAPFPCRPLPDFRHTGHDAPFYATMSTSVLEDGCAPLPGAVPSRPEDHVGQGPFSGSRRHVEAQQAGPAGTATFSRSDRLSDPTSSHGPCADIRYRGLMVLGLDGLAPTSSPNAPSWGPEEPGVARPERLGRPKSFPSIYAGPHQSTVWSQDDELNANYYRHTLSDSLYVPLEAGGPPTPSRSPRPLPLPQQPPRLPPLPGHTQWDIDELPRPPPPLVGPIYRDHPPRPLHARAVSLDHSPTHAPSPGTRQLPRLLTDSTSMHEIPSVLQYPPLSCAPSENVAAVFTLPASGYGSSSSCPSYFTPGPRLDQRYGENHEWCHRFPDHDSPIEMPISAPVDHGRFQPYPAYRRGHSRASSVQDETADSADCLHTPSSATTSTARLITPPESPSRGRPTSGISSASELGLQMSTILPRPRPSPRAPNSEPNEAAGTKQKKPHKCEHPDCGRAFKRAEHLRRHERVHTQERPFECPAYACGMRFSRHDNLLQHQKTHFKNGKTRRAVAARLAQAEAARAAEFGFTHTFVPNYG